MINCSISPRTQCIETNTHGLEGYHSRCGRLDDEAVREKLWFKTIVFFSLLLKLKIRKYS